MLSSLKSSDNPAIYTSKEVYTYKDLYHLVKKHQDRTPIFYANNNIECIIHILYMLENKLSFFPINPRIPVLPKIDLAPGGKIHLYTSGSTGQPKIATLLEEQLTVNVINGHKELIMSPQDCWLLSLSLAHIGGLIILFRAFTQEASIALDPNISNITHLSLVPIQLQQLLDNGHHYTKLKSILLGGAPLNYKQCIEAYQQNIPIYITYGMTEMGPQIACSKFHPNNKKLTASILQGKKIKIGEDGSILVKGDSLFSGYYPENTPPLTKGYFITGDIGKIINNKLQVQGRKAGCMISGGENIDLAYLKKTILAVENILSCTVISRKDTQWGHRPVVKIKSSKPITKTEIKDQLKKILPNYYIPSESDIFLL